MNLFLNKLVLSRIRNNYFLWMIWQISFLCLSVCFILFPKTARAQGYVDLYIKEDVALKDRFNKDKFDKFIPAKIYNIKNKTIKFNLAFKNGIGATGFFKFGIENLDQLEGWRFIVKHKDQDVSNQEIRMEHNQTITLNIEVEVPENPVWNYDYTDYVFHQIYAPKNDSINDNIVALGIAFSMTRQYAKLNRAHKDYLHIAFKPENAHEIIEIKRPQLNSESRINLLLNQTRKEHSIRFKITNKGNTFIENPIFLIHHTLENHSEIDPIVQFHSDVKITNIYFNNSEVIYEGIEDIPLDLENRFTLSDIVLFPNTGFYVEFKFKIKPINITNPVKTDYYRFNIHLSEEKHPLPINEAYYYQIVWPKIKLEQAVFKTECSKNYDIQNLKHALEINAFIDNKCLMMKYTVTNLTDHEFKPDNIGLNFQIPNDLIPISPTDGFYYDQGKHFHLRSQNGLYKIDLSTESFSYYHEFINGTRKTIEFYLKLKPNPELIR